MKTTQDFELPPDLLNQAMATTTNGLTIADATQPDLPLVYVNSGFTQMTGYSAEEVIGQNCRFLQGDDRDQPDLDELRAALREGRGCTVTLRNYRKDGSLFWNELILSPLHDAQGQLTHFVGIQQDITARKHLEQQIRDTLARREHEVYTTIEVAQEIAAAPALDDLFRRVVELIKARFGYYHAHVYTLEGDELVMQEGTGAAGRQMKAAGHQIALAAEQSLVARAAREGQPVLIADVAQVPGWLPNALLPETQSELAVPIMLREQVLGVLDVQSDSLGGLSEEDELLLIGLCDQIAIAIDHRRTEMEWQQAEDARRESEARLAEALEVAQLGHWELDVTTLMFTFNDQFYALMGTTAEQEGGYQMPAARYAEKFIPPEEMHVVAEGTQAAMETTDPNYQRQIEHRIIRGDGTEGYLQVRVRIVKDEQGQTVRVYGANQDITERKQAELERERLLAEVQESERLTRTIIDSTPDWIFIKDQDHLYRMVNQGYANSMHMEPDEFVGKNDLDVGFPEAIVKGDPKQGIRGFWADDRQVMDSGETKFVPSEPAVVDGEARTLSTIKVPLRDDSGAVWGVLGYVRDITENMRVQAQLETSQAQLSEALDMAQMAYWELDLASLKLILNDTYYAILGTTAEQEGGYALAVDDYARRFVHPEDADIIETEIEKVIAATDPAYSNQIEYRLIRANGEERHVFVKFRIAKNEQGQTVKAYGMLQDITERKRIENERDRIFTQSLNLLCIAGFDGYFKRLNPAWENILGFTPAELLPEPFINIVHPDDHAVVMTEVEKLASGRETNAFEIRCRCKDGTYKWTLWTATPFPDQEGFYATGHDITERRQAEEALAQSLAETKEQTQRLARLNQMGTALQAATTLDEIFQVASQQTLQIIAGDRASIALLAPSGDHFEILALSGLKGAIPTGTQLPIEGTVLGKCLTERQLIIVNRDGPDWDDYLETRQFTKQGLHSIMSAPLIAGGRMVGTLNLGSQKPHAFSETEQSLMLQIVAILASAIDNERLLEQLQTRAAELEIVAEVSTTVTSTLDPQHLLQQVVDLTKASFNLYHAHIYLLDEEDILVLTAGAGDIGHRMVTEGRTIPLAQEQSLVARAARTRHGVIVNDVQADPGFLPHPLLPETRSEMAVPLIVGDQVLGVLDTQSDRVDRFTEEDVQVKTTLAAQVAVALQNAYQYEQAQAALEALRQSEAQLSEALDIARLANWEFDFESTILTVDEQFYSILGTTAEQEGGYDLPVELFIQKFIHPDDGDVLPTEIQRALQQTDPNYEGQIEYRLLRPNDQLGYVIVRYKLIRDEQGQVVKAYGTFHDVTERWQAEVEHKRVFALIEATPDLVGLANAEGQTIYLNQAGRTMMGFGTDEDLSKISMAEYCSDWAAELLVNKGMPTALREGTWSSEMALLTRNGREIPGSQVLMAQTDAEGKLEFFGTIIRDITERKLAEAELEENLRELQATQHALSREGWQTLEETLSLPDGYIFDRAAVQPADELWIPELRLAAERKALVPPSHVSEHKPENGEESKVAVAPLLIHDQTIGAIGVYEDPERPLSSDELALVKGVSEQVALALESARLFEESQRNSQLLSKRVRELNCMNDVGREIEKTPPIPQLLQWVTERIPTAMQFPDLCVVAIKFEDQLYGVADALDLPGQMVNGLYIGGEIRGRIYIAYTEKHDFLNEESALLGGIATRLSGYIENRHLFEQTRRRAEQERLINTITQKIQSTTTVEKALQTTIQELGQTFQARYTRVEIKTNGEGKHHQTPPNGPDGTDKPK